MPSVVVEASSTSPASPVGFTDPQEVMEGNLPTENPDAPYP